jgi:hypothetical protein
VVILDPFANPLIQTFHHTLARVCFQSKAQDTFAWKVSDVIVSDDTLTEECDEDGFHPIPSGWTCAATFTLAKVPTYSGVRKTQHKDTDNFLVVSVPVKIC